MNKPDHGSAQTVIEARSITVRIGLTYNVTPCLTQSLRCSNSPTSEPRTMPRALPLTLP
jgi:hypothetical protein